MDDFEQEQLHEARTPKPRKAVKNPGSRPRQRRAVVEEEYDDYDDEVELETTRSGETLSSLDQALPSLIISCFTKLI